MANICTNMLFCSTESKNVLKQVEEYLQKTFETYHLEIDEDGDFLEAEFNSKWSFPMEEMENGYVIWTCKPQKRTLFFTEKLEIPNGVASLPRLIFKATKNQLSVYALKVTKRPTAKTKLYYAPFFNVYESGNVCMGTVTIKAQKSQSLEEFIHLWEELFFNSYFSHLLDDYNPIKENIVSLWKDLIDTDKSFPNEQLKKNGKTLKNIL